MYQVDTYKSETLIIKSKFNLYFKKIQIIQLWPNFLKASDNLIPSVTFFFYKMIGMHNKPTTSILMEHSQLFM